jgi:hypothetical protein
MERLLRPQALLDPVECIFSIKRVLKLDLAGRVDLVDTDLHGRRDEGEKRVPYGFHIKIEPMFSLEFVQFPPVEVN